MTATAVPVTIWAGCYSDSWQELIVPEAFSHPAKAARGLSHRIYRHLLDSGYVRPGDTILDPFAGIGGFCLDAMTYGLRYIGVELEPRFVTLAQQNLALWRQRYGFTGGMVVQGDSRQLRAVLAGRRLAIGGTLPGAINAAIVSSPPYAGSIHDGNGIDHAKLTGNTPGPHTQAAAEGYGYSVGQLGAMPPGQVGCVVGSPPFGPLDTQDTPFFREHRAAMGRNPSALGGTPGDFGTTPGQLGAMPPGVVVSSPPYEGSAVSALSALHASGGQGNAYRRTGQSPRARQAMVEEQYGCSPGQLGHEQGDTFWSASAQIMAELAALLPPGAVCAWVLKAYVSKGRIVPFPDQWRALCEAHGFQLVEEIHASLVEHHGTQEGLFDGPQQVTTEKKSFFRRLAEKKGSPRIDYETVLIMRKAGDVGGVCVVSSPPFHESLSSGETASAMKSRWGNGQLGGDWGQSYGTTPGNLGNMPAGMCVVSSPPFQASLESQDTAFNAVARPGRTIQCASYGSTPGNLGTMPVETR